MADKKTVQVRKKNQQPVEKALENEEQLQDLVDELNNKDAISFDNGREWLKVKQLRLKSLSELKAMLYPSESKPTATGPHKEASPESVHEAESAEEAVDKPRADAADSSGSAGGSAEKRVRAPQPAHVDSQQLNDLQQKIHGVEAEVARVGKEIREEVNVLAQEKLAALDTVYQRIETAKAQVSEFYEQISDGIEITEEIVRQFRVGEAEILRDSLKTVEEERDELRSQLNKDRDRIDELDRELKRAVSGQGAYDIEELKRREAQVGLKEQDVRDRKQLEALNMTLQTQLSELRVANETFKSAAQEYERDDQARSENLRLRDQLEAFESEKSRLLSKLDQLNKDANAAGAWKSRYLAEADVRRNVEGELRDAEHSIQNLKAQVATLLDGEEQVRKDGEALLARSKDLESEFNRQKATMLEAMEAQAEARIADQLNSLSHELESAQRARDLAEDKLQQLSLERKEVRELNSQKTSLANKIASLREEIQQKTDERNDLNSQLAENESRLRQWMDAWESRMETLDLETREYREQQIRPLEDRKSELEGERSALEKEIELLSKRCDDKRRELENVTKVEVDEQKRTESIRRTPFRPSTDVKDAGSEVEWLSNLRQSIKDAGFYYPRRLVDAFHTSLKTAKWSPITALAGVSGTGKSELPRLYAKFGGMHFQSLPVQPNWDSPQDLFGFYNYMDGRYQATEFLQALNQSGPLLEKDQMVLMLLDEMNLARIEQYLSDILSKLGSVADGEAGETPSIPVNIGLGKEYSVALNRNVLLVGTMNEDESTHILSDKVLDRGNCLSFPRPRKLHRRPTKEAAEPTWKLSYAAWQKWIQDPTESNRNDDGFSSEVVQIITGALEKINEGLGCVHRAIGHRVLQAIEAYVANHPRTRADPTNGWKVAFGDQLAQRIMPKLRGIEVESDAGKQCLAKVREVVTEYAEDLETDFKDAHSDSQYFLWSNSSYLESDRS